MSINVRIYNADYIKYPEIAYNSIIKLEEKKTIFLSSKILSNISCKEFLDNLIEGKFVEKDFLEYIKEEYGEPWYSSYPIDMDTIIEALCKWTSLEENIILNYLRVWFSHISLNNISWRRIIFNNLTYYFGDSPEIEINPIPKEYRNYQLERKYSSTKLELDKDTYNQVLESCEAAIALCDDELIILQLKNVLDKIKKE